MTGQCVNFAAAIDGVSYRVQVFGGMVSIWTEDGRTLTRVGRASVLHCGEVSRVFACGRAQLPAKALRTAIVSALAAKAARAEVLRLRAERKAGGYERTSAPEPG